MLRIRGASANDLDQIVATHIKAFPGFFLTLLGPRFLYLLYRGFVEDDTGIILVACENSSICGFVAGTSAPSGFFSRLRRHGPAFFIAAGGAVLRAPILVTRRLTAAAFYRGEAPIGLSDAALLSSIAVPPEMGGRGVGRALLTRFAAAARANGSRYIYLTTDRDENRAANRFYESFGFELEATFARSGNRWMTRYVLNLNNRADGET